MAFLGALGAGIIGDLMGNSANKATIANQDNQQASAQAYAAAQQAKARQQQQQALMQALQMQQQYQQANPAPINQMGPIQGPPQQQAPQSFGGGVASPQGGPPQMPGQQQNLQGAMQQQRPPMPQMQQQPPPQQPQQQPQPQQFQRLQQLYPMVQQMLRSSQPGMRSGGAM